MKKFVLITVCFTPPNAERMEGWVKLLASISDRIEGQVAYEMG